MMPFHPFDDPSVRLTGRWGHYGNGMAATAPGSYGEIAFRGITALLKFDITGNPYPSLPHLWISVDGSAMVEAAVDSHIRLTAHDDGAHICRFILKSAVEARSRWTLPLESHICFLGYAGEAAELPPDNRLIMEFVGDSITEGIFSDNDFDSVYPYENDQFNRVYQDDVCSTYAWRCAELLNVRPLFQAYGAVGCTKGGKGTVPAAPSAYPYNFEGSPVSDLQPDYIVINHGTNDRGADKPVYMEALFQLLDTIRSLRPKAKIFVIVPFLGLRPNTMRAGIERYNETRSEQVTLIDTADWIDATPLHPLRCGHKIAGDRLAEALRPLL